MRNAAATSDQYLPSSSALGSRQGHRPCDGPDRRFKWLGPPPERLSLPVLAALGDIFDCTPADLIATRAENPPSAESPPAMRSSTCRRSVPSAPASGPKDDPHPRPRRGPVLHPLRPRTAAGGEPLTRGLHLPELHDQSSGDLRDLHRMRSRAAHSRPRAGRREALHRLRRRDR
nr:helix-turn-helix transcriptional regulator [Streptomyces sp. FIT100]